MNRLKKHLNRLAFTVLAPLSLCALEYNSDISISSESPKFFQSSCIKFSGTLFDYFDNDTRAWLISPKISYYLGGHPGFTIAGGLRHDFGPITLGNHLFFNIYNDKSSSIYQFGKAFDVLHDRWEARINYYFPSKVKMPDVFMLYDIASCIEGEFIYKTPYLNFGVNDMYSFGDRKNQVTLKVSLPFEKFLIGSNVSFQQDQPLKMGLSLTYNFLSSEKKDNKSKNALYRHLPKFDRKPLKRPQKPIIVPSPPPPPAPEVQEPEKPIEPPKMTWWEWFWSTPTEVDYSQLGMGRDGIDHVKTSDTPISAPAIEIPKESMVDAAIQTEKSSSPSSPRSAPSNQSWSSSGSSAQGVPSSLPELPASVEYNSETNYSPSGESYDFDHPENNWETVNPDLKLK